MKREIYLKSQNPLAAIKLASSKKPIKRNRADVILNREPIQYQNGYRFVLIGNNKEYKLLENGDCFNVKLHRLIAKTKTGTNTKSYAYKINNKNFYITRLLMFYFKNHEYNAVSEMPKVSPKDKNNTNWKLENLEFVSQADINLKYDMKPTCKKPPKIKDTIENLEIAKSMLKRKLPYRTMAEPCKTSTMSVCRFIKRHNLKSQIAA